jgi:quercetin dioxygenase-like cupin family protein
MKKSLIVLAVAASTIVAAFVGVAQAQKAKKVRYVSSEKASYKEMAGSGPSMHVLRGDPDKGPHATFTKFTPGYDAGMHTHTNDVSCVVIKGAYLYKDEAGEKRVGPGEYIFIPGGHKHWSGGDKTEGALFYQEGSGKFDLIPAK